jgi:toxin CcdB
MAQFDVHRNADARSRATVPYVLDVQSDLLSDLATRAVVPLVIEKRFAKAASRLNPVLEIENARVVMSTAEIVGVPRRALGERIGSLAPQRDAIVAAIDLLVLGF